MERQWKNGGVGRVERQWKNGGVSGMEESIE